MRYEFKTSYCSAQILPNMSVCATGFVKRRLKVLVNFIRDHITNTHLGTLLSSGTSVSYFIINLAFMLEEQKHLIAVQTSHEKAMFLR